MAAEEGISPATLYHGRQQARRGDGLFPDVGADPEGFGLSSAEGWTARDPFTAVMETAALRRIRTRRVLPKARAHSAADHGLANGL